MFDTRRTFLGRLAAAAAAALAVPRRLLSGTVGETGADSPARPGPARRADGLPAVPGGPLQEAFWQELRREFLIPPEEAFFNTGTLGASPRVVLDAVVEHMTHVDRDLAHWDYIPGHENYFSGYYEQKELRGKLAGLINAPSPEEVALTQNATFGMNFVANGLPLERDAEVVVMEGAHVGGRCGWQLRDQRRGIHVRQVPVPVPPESPEGLIRAYEEGTTPRTRVWAIPHLTSGTAILFPVKEMCRRARERGILTVVDGAQTLGHLAIDVQELGCDAYFSSPHKWLLAPKGTGVLWVRGEILETLWPTLASGQYENYEDGAFRLQQYGTSNLSLHVGLEKAIDFHRNIGSERIEERIVGLADRLRAGLAEIPGVELVSPVHPELRSATTVWRHDGWDDMKALQEALWERARIRVRSIGDRGVRQCCHIYTLAADVERTLETVEELARGAGP